MHALLQRKRPSAQARPRRYATAAGLTIPANLKPSGGRGFSTVVHDFSIGGFSGTAAGPLREGTLCWLYVPGIEPLACEVIWWRDNAVGCAFHDLLDFGTYETIVAGCRIPARL